MPVFFVNAYSVLGFVEVVPIGRSQHLGNVRHVLSYDPLSTIAVVSRYGIG